MTSSQIANQPAYPINSGPPELRAGPTYRHWASATILAGLNASKNPGNYTGAESIRQLNVAEAVRQADLLCHVLATTQPPTP